MFCNYYWCRTSRIVIAHSLQKKGIKPLILEKNYVGFSWNFIFVGILLPMTPKWQCTLPDYQYSVKDPNGFMDKENIVKYLKKYSEFVKADILEGIDLKHLVKKNEKFFISTNRGNFEADQVVIATGAYHVPKIRHPHSENYQPISCKLMRENIKMQIHYQMDLS